MCHMAEQGRNGHRQATGDGPTPLLYQVKMLCYSSKLRYPSIYSALQTSFCDIFTTKHSRIIVYLFEKGHEIQVQESVGS